MDCYPRLQRLLQRGNAMNYWMLVLNVIFLAYGASLSAFYLDRKNSMACPKKEYFSADFDMSRHFSLVQPNFERECVSADPISLQHAVRDALLFFKRYNKTHARVMAPQPFSTQILSYKKSIETLAFIDQTIEEDKATGVFRIQDPAFLAQNLGFVAWKPYYEQTHKREHKATSDKKIRLTSYVIYRAPGSYEKTAEHSCALYQLVNSKKHLSLTKQDVLAGALEENPQYAACVKPLAWVSPATLEEAMLQGTVLLVMPDKQERAFTVNLSNGHKFNAKLRGLSKQKIYWFFLERNNKDDVKTLIDRSNRRKGIVFAGDLHALGLGKIIAIQYFNKKNKRRELRLGVLGDTGSAFDRNLYHLDLFGGIISSKNELKSYLSNFPPAVKAFIVYRK